MKYREVKQGEKIRVAFLYLVAAIFPSWESFYYQLLSDKRFEIKLFYVDDGVDSSNPEKQTAEKFLIERGIKYSIFSEDEFEMFYPHIAVIQKPYEYKTCKPRLWSRRLKKNGIRVVYIPYGIEISDTETARHDHFREPVIKNAWRIYTLSSDFVKEYRKYCENSGSVRALGLPRFDALVKKGRFILSEEIARKASGRKIIVWHCHFAKSVTTGRAIKQVTPYMREYIRFAGYIKRQRDLFYIFLPHPRFADYAKDLDSEESEAKESVKLLHLLSGLENVFIDWANDYRHTLLNANAVITDRSSLMVEACVPDVPVLYLKNRDYEEKMFPPLLPLINSFYQGTGCDEMVLFLEMVSSGRDERAKLRNEAFQNCVPYLDGKCSERIADDIVESIGSKSEPAEQSHKLVFFGAGNYLNMIMSYYDFPENYTIMAVFDNNSEKWGKELYGIKISDPMAIQNIEFDKVIIAAGTANEEQIYKQLKFDLEVPDNKIEYLEYLSVL